jgi:hypothetical protein
MRKVEQRGDMPTCDNATLADFELQRIYHGERMLALIDDRPSIFATCRFTKVTRISYGKLNQLASPIRPNYSNGTAQSQGCWIWQTDRRITGASDKSAEPGGAYEGGVRPLWVGSGYDSKSNKPSHVPSSLLRMLQLFGSLSC